MYWNFFFHKLFAAYNCLWIHEISEWVWRMAGNSQNCPAVHFSHEISWMHSKLCNFLTTLLQSLYNIKHYKMFLINPGHGYLVATISKWWIFRDTARGTIFELHRCVIEGSVSQIILAATGKPRKPVFMKTYHLRGYIKYSHTLNYWQKPKCAPSGHNILHMVYSIKAPLFCFVLISKYNDKEMNLIQKTVKCGKWLTECIPMWKLLRLYGLFLTYLEKIRSIFFAPFYLACILHIARYFRQCLWNGMVRGQFCHIPCF